MRDSSGVTWVTTAEAARFLADAEPFLLSDPVANNVLLTEARFWSWLPDPAPGACFGWWADANGTHGAFVDIPDHAPVCSPLSTASIAHLARELVNATSLGVEDRDVTAVTEAWAAHGQVLRPKVRMTLLRLDSLRAPALPTGTARVADASDLPLLRSWFRLFRDRHPDDHSSPEFVVDHPLGAGGIVVWEIHGRPVAMASRTPEMAGMTRIGLAFQPAEGTTYSDAAFVSACVEAAKTADHVLVLSGSPSSAGAYVSLGFAPVLDRVVLEVLGERAS
jgi:hypothetical protein